MIRLIIVIILGIGAFLIRFAYPELTETQLLIRFWEYWVTVLFIYAIIVISLKKDKGEQSNART